VARDGKTLWKYSILDPFGNFKLEADILRLQRLSPNQVILIRSVNRSLKSPSSVPRMARNVSPVVSVAKIVAERPMASK